MNKSDRRYYLQRAEEEIARAQSSSLEKVVEFHYMLGALYLDRVYGDGSSPPANLEDGGQARTLRSDRSGGRGERRQSVAVRGLASRDRSAR